MVTIWDGALLSYTQLSNVKPSNYEWGSDEPRYRAAITAKNVQTRHAVGNFCISSGHCF